MKHNLYFLGTTLVSGLASVGLAVQPVQAANITATETNGNWNLIEFVFTPASDDDFDTLLIDEQAIDLGPYDIQIELTDFAPNSSVPLIIGKFVQNLTDITWTEFNIGIGTGLGSAYSPLDPSSGLFVTTDAVLDVTTPFDLFFFSGGGLQGFAQSSVSGNSISFFDGIADPGLGTIPIFVLNVPTDANGNAIFTVRQTAVPEPLTLFGVGTALGFGSFFKRQQGKNQKKNNA